MVVIMAAVVLVVAVAVVLVVVVMMMMMMVIVVAGDRDIPRRHMTHVVSMIDGLFVIDLGHVACLVVV